MAYLILIIFFRSHIYLSRKSAFLLLKTSKMSENGCFVVIRWKVGESFVGENNVLRLYLSIKKYRFCSVCCTRFWLKSISFLFLNTVNWFKRFAACFKFTKMKNHVFEACFKFTTWKMTFLKHISSLQNETARVYKINDATRFQSVFQVCRMQKLFLKRFSSLHNEKTFLKRFHVYKMKKKRFWKMFQVYQMKKHVFEACFKFTEWKKSFWGFFIFKN